MPTDYANVQYTPEWYELRISSIMATKITLLRERIEAWSHKHGYKNIGNINETRNEDGEIIWRRTDWEYVDDTYNHYINDGDYYPYPTTLKKMNLLWKKYYITEKIGDSY